jgi:microsomal dipeptidase-like Zn-dependent dipeptidase
MTWLLGLLALGVVAFFVLGGRAERWINVVTPTPLPAVGREARALHRSSPVVDLHADSLLFGRDLLVRSDVGHVDLPRLREGGVALQVFGAPTKFPYSRDLHHTAADGFDLLTLIGLAGRNPLAVRGPYGRALWMAERLDAFVAASDGRLVWIRTRADLESLLAARAAGGDVVGALFSLEGAHALEHGPGDLDAFFDAGVRMIGLAHFFDNRYAGSAHGVAKGGLSDEGRALVRRMQERGVVVDLAHVSPAAIDDVLSLATRPVVFSHGGVRATCDNPRNLSDAQLRAIAAGGGVIGIGYFDLAVCGEGLASILAAVQHVIGVVGDDHVALGSDYDGGTRVGFDTSQLPALTQALLDAGIPPASVAKILGGNAIRVLRATLPPGPVAGAATTAPASG